MERSDRRHIFYLYLRETWQRAARRARALKPLPRCYYRGVPDRLIVAPTDLRPTDVFIAEEILEGRFLLAGRELITGGDSPFSLEMPSPGFAARLHNFSWLRHLRADKSERACAVARRIVDQWISSHGRPMPGPSWELDIAAQRLISWLSHSPVILNGAEAGFYRRFMKSLAVHLRALQRAAPDAPDGELRFRVQIAIAMASVAMPASAAMIRRAGRALDRQIERQILPDGGHISRNPRASLDLLFDLLPLRQTYVNLGHDVPSKLIAGIDRMYPALRFFRHQGGDLALFNGATSTLANELMSVLRYDETAGQPFKALPHTGYHRLSAGNSVVIVDTGLPHSTALSRNAHAGALSFEMSSGKYRFIINSGSPKFASGDYRRMVRSTAAHSVAIVNETSSSRISQSSYLGPVLAGGIREVEAVRTDNADGSQRLIAHHDGYLRAFGVTYQRELVMSADGRLISGHERFLAREGKSPDDSASASAVVRFHIHPAIDLVEVDKETVLLKAPDGEAWLFSAPGLEVLITEDVFFADASGIRASEQLEIDVSVAEHPDIRWELKRHK